MCAISSYVRFIYPPLFNCHYNLSIFQYLTNKHENPSKTASSLCLLSHFFHLSQAYILHALIRTHHKLGWDIACEKCFSSARFAFKTYPNQPCPFSLSPLKV